MQLLRYTLLLLAFVFKISAFSQLQLSDKAEIAIVTLGPYQEELYSVFGHSGIRVYDPTLEIDRFYNYGVFDFKQENFYLNFAKGLMKYRLGVSHYLPTIRAYIRQNRYVKEQYLNLDKKEKQLFFDFLQNNAKPENAEYFYNYVYDNCATKIRDVIDRLLPRQVQYDLSYKQKGKSVRTLMDDHMTYRPWGDWIIDIILGTTVDSEAPARLYMFLPEYVFKALEGATIDKNGQKFPFVKQTVDVFVPEKKRYKNSVWTPLNVFIILFFSVGFITNRNYKTGIRTRSVDTILFGLVGFLGLWVAFLWWGTAHLSSNNLNIFWAMPFHFPVVFFMNKKKFNPFVRGYFKAVAYWYCLLLIAWPFLPQPLGMPMVPLVLAMILRAFYVAYDLGKVKADDNKRR